VDALTAMIYKSAPGELDGVYLRGMSALNAGADALVDIAE
jgi:hypothetical protein